MLRLTTPICACFFIVILLFSGSYLSLAQCSITFPPGQICAGDACNTGPTTFTYGGGTAPGPGISYKWNFGDPNIETDTLTTTTLTASYSYSQPGTYTVTVTEIINGVEQLPACSSSPVQVAGFGEFTIGPDENLGPQEEEFCKEDVPQQLSAVFQGGSAPAGATYLWAGPGVTDAVKNNQTISIIEEGCYSLEITDPATGCKRTNKLTVSLYKPDPSQPPPPQDQARWYFGTNGGIRFPGNQPVADPGRTFNAPEGSSSVLNSRGQLLFYTDGITVYDSLGNPMPDIDGNLVSGPREIDGGEGLNGSPAAAQGVTIVAQPGCNDCQSVYFVFTTTEISASGSQLFYSVVDMRQNNSLGQVIQKNVPLSPTIPTTERVIAVRGNPSDPNAPQTTWIITHDFSTNTFRVYPLTPQGVGAPETYSVGSNHGPETAKGEGYMKISPDGTKLAVVIPGSNGGNNIIEIFDFDSTTGEVSNPVQLNVGAAPPTAYGLEFSGSQLYVSLRGSGTAQSQLVRYDLSGADSLMIAISKDTIATSTQQFGGLQIGPDQKIYLAIQGSSNLGVINNPGAADPAQVDFQETGFDLKGGTSGLGLPNNSPSESRSYGQDFAYEGPPCTFANTPVQYRFQAQPDRAGGDPTKSTYLWTFPNGVTYTTAEVTHSFPGPGTYTVGLTIYNDCIPEGEIIEPKTIVISENPPIVNLGPDQNVCLATNPVTLSAYPATVNPAGVQYVWARPDGSLDNKKTISATLPGTYTVVVFSANGECTQTDNITINFAGPTVNLGADTTLCQAGSIILNAGNPGFVYLWNTGETSQAITVTPAITTTYTVTVTDPAFPTCPVSDNITVRVGTAPVVTASSTPASSCAPGAIGSIILSPPPAGDQYTYLWSNGATSSILTAPPGVYTVIVTNASGCSTTITAKIDATGSNLNYTPAIQPATCADQDGTITLTQQPGSSAGVSFIWRNSSGNPVGALDVAELEALPGTYSVEITDAAGCKFSLTDLVINADPNAPAQPNPTTVITGCGNGSFSAILYPGYNGSVPVTYQWFDPNGAFVPTDATTGTATVTQPGSYAIIVSNVSDNACFAENFVTVTAPTSAPFTIADRAACPGQVIEIDATTAGYNSYIWTGPNGAIVSNGPRAQITQAGTYTVTARNATTGCTATDQVNVTFNAPAPSAPTAQNQAICVGQPVPSLSATGTNIRWYSNANLTSQVGSGNNFTPNINNQAPGTYTFYATQSNATGCQSAAIPVTVTVNALPGIPSVANPNQVICAGSGISQFNISNPGNGTYQWFNNAALTTVVGNGSSFLPNLSPNAAPGVYTFYVTQTIQSAGNCRSQPATVTLTINRSPIVNLGPDRSICIDDSLTLDATNAGATYSWSTTQTTPTIRPTRSGTYSVTVIIGNCQVTDEVTLTVLPSVRTNVPTREVALCTSDRPINPVTLDAGPGEGFKYFWPQLNRTERTVEASQPGVYEVLITDGSGCSKTERITVIERCEARVFVPNAFSPNGEGIAENETFKISGQYVIDSRIIIYNRWGEVVYTAEDILNPANFWDGMYLGQPAPIGSYAYKITYKSADYPEREPTVLRGGVMLLR